MSLIKASLVALVAFTMLASAEVIPTPAEQQDASISAFTRYCTHYNTPAGSHALCQEYADLDKPVAYYRAFLSRLFADQSLTDADRDKILEPLKPYYVMLKRSIVLMDQIAAEQHTEFITYCRQHIENPVCRSSVNRSLYEEEEEEEFATRRVRPIRTDAAITMEEEIFSLEEELYDLGFGQFP